MRYLLIVLLRSIAIITVLQIVACSDKSTVLTSDGNDLSYVSSWSLDLELQLEEIDGTSATSFMAGDTVRMVLVVTNLTGSPRIVRFPNSHQYDFVVLDSESDMPHWRWSSGKVFLASPSSLELEPWEIRAMSVLWDQRTGAGPLLECDLYKAEGLLPGRYDPVDSSFTAFVRSPAIQFEITLPD
jgi:hypothetical protein